MLRQAANSTIDPYDPNIVIRIELGVGYNAFESDFYYKFYKILKTGYQHSQGEGYWTAIKSDKREERVQEDYQELLQLSYHATKGIISPDTMPLQEVDDEYIVKRIRQIIKKEEDFFCQFDFYNELKELIATHSEVVRLTTQNKKLTALVEKQSEIIEKLNDQIEGQKEIIKKQEEIIEFQDKKIQKIENDCETMKGMLSQLLGKFCQIESRIGGQPSSTTQEEKNTSSKPTFF